MILPPEDLPDIQSVEFRWKQYQTQEDYEEAVFRQLYVEIVSDEKAVNSFPVTSREVLYDQYSVAWSSSTSEDENGNVTTYESKRYGSLTGNIEKTAQYHGYDSYSEMLASLENASGDVLQFLADCEEGEEYDTWYLSFISNVETFHRCEIESMDLTDAGLLNVDWEGLYIHDDPAPCYNCVTEVLTVKHGVWDEVKGTYQSRGSTSLQEDFDSKVSGVRIISRTESSPQKAEKKDSIPVLYQQTETVQWWQGDENPGSEYKNWDGKEDFELAMKNLCKKSGDELIAVLPKGDELKIYTVYSGMPREHRLLWMNLSEDGELYVSDIADMRQKEGLQQSCTSWLSTIFADTLTLPEGALPSDAIKSVQWDKLNRWWYDADMSMAEIEGYPWDESKGMFPYQLRISCKGCDYSKTKQDQTILVNELMRDRYDYCAAEPDETGAGDGTGGWFCVNGLTDRIAKQHGYADEAAMMTAQLSTGTEPVFLHDCVEDKEFDALYLTDIESRTYQDCRVTDLTLESDGKMHVTWTALKKDTPDKYGEDPNIFSSVLLVRHGILEQVKEWYFERVEYDASKAAGYRELTEKPLTVKKTGKIVPVTEHEVLKDMVTVSKHSISSQDETGQTFTETEMSCQSRDGNLEKIAAIHKYETGLEMLTDLEKIDVDEHVLISCEEGEEYDKWYLSFIYDKDAYNSCEISSLSGEDYYLSIGLSLMHNENSSDPFCNVFTHILTLPHGQFQSIRSLGHYITSSKLYDESNAEQFAESLSEPLKLVLYGGHRMSSASSETYLYDEHIEKHEEITAEDLPDWEGRADYERALQTLTAEDGSGKLAVLPEKDKLKIYYTDQASSCNYGSRISGLTRITN